MQLISAFTGSRGRTAEVKAVPVPKAQMMGRQDWRYVSGGAQSVVRKAHPSDTDITSLAFSRDNVTLLSRAGDDTLKVTFPPFHTLPPYSPSSVREHGIWESDVLFSIGKPLH